MLRRLCLFALLFALNSELKADCAYSQLKMVSDFNTMRGGLLKKGTLMTNVIAFDCKGDPATFSTDSRNHDKRNDQLLQLKKGDRITCNSIREGYFAGKYGLWAAIDDFDLPENGTTSLLWAVLPIESLSLESYFLFTLQKDIHSLEKGDTILSFYNNPNRNDLFFIIKNNKRHFLPDYFQAEIKPELQLLETDTAQIDYFLTTEAKAFKPIQFYYVFDWRKYLLKTGPYFLIGMILLLSLFYLRYYYIKPVAK